jgi:tRNA C32,U32 (ribose-2'-O)-methylase TrmJ
MADEVWQIPGTEEAESLSLPQAAAVLMYACTVSS